MKRIALIVALLSTHTAAQTTTSPAPTVAVGCVTRAMHNGSLAGAPGVPPATPASAPALANAQEPTGGLLLEGAKSAGAGGDQAAKPMSYVLDGKTAELELHVGHRMEVTGTLRTIEKGDPGAEARTQHLQVASFKMLGQCPRAAGPQNGVNPR